MIGLVLVTHGRLAAEFVGHPATSAVLKAGRCEDLVKTKAQGQNNK